MRRFDSITGFVSSQKILVGTPISYHDCARLETRASRADGTRDFKADFDRSTIPAAVRPSGVEIFCDPVVEQDSDTTLCKNDHLAAGTESDNVRRVAVLGLSAI